MKSQYEEMFGEGYTGRPRSDELAVGSPTGNPTVTRAARARATRILRALHKSEFEELMRKEAEYLQENVKGLSLKRENNETMVQKG